jgi:hypothetical protein
MRRYWRKTAMMTAAFLWSGGYALTTTVDLKGTIADSTAQPIGGAIVRLIKADLRDTTDSDGKFEIKGSVTGAAIKSASLPRFSSPVIRNGSACFSITGGKTVASVTLLDLKGRTIERIFNEEMAIGNYSIPLARLTPSRQVYMVSVAIGSKVSLFKYCSIQSHPSAGRTAAGRGVAKRAEGSNSIDTLVAVKLGYATIKVPIKDYSTDVGLSKMGSSTKRTESPSVPMHLVMTSTGSKVVGGLTKRTRLAAAQADTFLYPVKKWIPSTQWTGCPDWLELTVKQIIANGNWKKAVVSKDTTKAGSDSVVTKIDTVWETGIQTLWQGSKKVRFTGSAVNLSGFDSLKIPSGTIYSISVFTEPFATVKGSITANFILNPTSDYTASGDTATKTVYTKAAYAWNGFAHTGGSKDSSVFFAGPAESTSVILNSSNDPSGPGPGFTIQTVCTTQVTDSITITMLFDISRSLFFVLTDTAKFYVEPAFAGTEHGVPSVVVFAGKQGRIDGYKYYYVCNSDQGSIDADSSAPPLWSDTTLGFTGWLNMVYDPTGKFLVGAGMRDNDGSFGPWGFVNNYDTTAGNLYLGYTGPGQGQSRLFGFRPAHAVGDSCVARVYQPACMVGSPGNLSLSHKRSGQAKFVLQIRQQ